MFKVLFICTDNVGRSLAAEYLLRAELERSGRCDILVDSAGIDAGSDTSSFPSACLGRLRELGIDASGYERIQLTREAILEHDLAMVVDAEQQSRVRERFGIEVPLFNEVLRGESTPLLVTLPGGEESGEERLLAMVDYIRSSLPQLIAQIDRLADRQRKNDGINRLTESL